MSSEQHNWCGLREKRNWPMGMLLWVLYRGHPFSFRGRPLSVVLKDNNLGCQLQPGV